MESDLVAGGLADAYPTHDFAEARVVADGIPAIVELEHHQAIGAGLERALELAEGVLAVAEERSPRWGSVQTRRVFCLHRGQ